MATYNENLNELESELPDHYFRPLYWTPMSSTQTLGDDIADFIENFMTPPRLASGVTDWKVLPWQRWLLRHMFEQLPDKRLKNREIYLQVPRKNGKSFLVSGIALYFLTHAVEGDQILLSASSTKQAHIVYDEVKRNVSNSELLQRLIKAQAYKISSKITTAWIETVGGDGDSSQGKAPFISIGDELHTWDSVTGRSSRGERLYQSLKTGSSDRDEFVFIGITTAGERTSGIAYSLYSKTVSIAKGELEDNTFAGYIWAAADEDDISSPETWKKANPNLASGIMPMEEMQKIYESAILTSTTAFERFHLNKWLPFSNNQQFISPYYMSQALRKDIPNSAPGARMVLGFDGSLFDDSTGIVGIDVDTGLIQLLGAWEKDPNNDDWFVDVEDVRLTFESLFMKYKILKVYCDPSRHMELVQQLAKKYGRGVVRDIPTGRTRMIPMSQDFKAEFYKAEKLWWNGDSRIKKHFMNAVENQAGLPAKESQRSARKIDFLACTILAYGALQEVRDQDSRRKGISIIR